MGSLESNLAGFSCPFEDLDNNLLEQVACVHARTSLEHFIERFGSQLKARGEGVVESLQNWLGQETDFATVWDPTFGQVYRAILSPSFHDPTNLVAGLSLRLGAHGLQGEWGLSLDGPHARLRWDLWLLPPADHITVSSDGRSALIRTRLGFSESSLNLVRADSGWEADGACRLLAFGTQRQKVILLGRESLAPTDMQQLPTEVVESIEPDMVKACQSAIALISVHAKPYLSWIERVLRYIVLLKQQGEHYSGSIDESCGLIHMSATSESLPVAETLIHEASHQYYCLISRLGPVDDSTDTRLYFSPAAQTKRPLRRIVLAYHAFANVFLFHRLLQAAGRKQDRDFSRDEASILELLDQLESPLRDNPALTPVGRAICDPLIKSLHGSV